MPSLLFSRNNCFAFLYLVLGFVHRIAPSVCSKSVFGWRIWRIWYRPLQVRSSGKIIVQLYGIACVSMTYAAGRGGGEGGVTDRDRATVIRVFLCMGHVGVAWTQGAGNGFTYLHLSPGERGSISARVGFLYLLNDSMSVHTPIRYPSMISCILPRYLKYNAVYSINPFEAFRRKHWRADPTIVASTTRNSIQFSSLEDNIRSVDNMLAGRSGGVSGYYPRAWYRSVSWVRAPPSAYSYKFVGTFSCAQIDLRKARERLLATYTRWKIDEQWDCWTLCAIQIEGKNRGGEGTTPVTSGLSRSWKVKVC